MHQSTTPSLSQTIKPRWASRQFVTVPIVQSLFPVNSGYCLSSEAVVMRQLRRWKRLRRRLLTRSHKRTSMGPSRSYWNGRTSGLQPEEIISMGSWVSCICFQLVAFVSEYTWHKALLIEYSMRFELTRICSLNCFQLVMGLYGGHSSLFLFASFIIMFPFSCIFFNACFCFCDRFF